MKNKNFINKIRYNFEKISDQIIREYLSEINKVLDLNNKEHPWMREDILDSEIYACDINGKKVKLYDILFDETATNSGRNIVIITGDKHIGKKTFANKLIELCLNSVNNQRGKLKKQLSKGNYRIPVVIDFDAIDHAEYCSLNELITQVIESKCDKRHNKQEIEWLRNTVNDLLINGRFLIYIKGQEEVLSLEERIHNVNLYKKEIQNLENGRRYNNVILFTINSEYDIKNTTLNNSHIITLEELKNKEIDKYLKAHIPALLPLINNSHDILDIIKYPEHLKMFEQLSNKEMLKEDEINFSNEFELYDFFLTQHIRRQLQKNMKNEEVNTQRESSIKISLQDYAWGRLLGKTNTRNPSSHFSFDDFKEIGILNETGDFSFSCLHYYLIAKYIMLNIKNDCKFSIPDKLLEAPMNISLVRAGKMMDSEDCFERFWNILDENNKCKINLFVRIAKQSQFYDFISHRLYKKIFDNLTRDFYDYTTIEALGNLENNAIEYLNSQYLRLEDYQTDEKNNIKKRYVYFLGISGSGIIDKMIDELLDPTTDLHLRYHIIRAMVESYNRHENSTKIINRRIDEISEYCAGISDPIIRSDFSLLYKKAKEQLWMTPESLDLIKKSLKEQLSNETYWKRAHAAGAIGRSKSFDAYKILIEQINKELEIIYTTKEKSRRNSIKVISYTVEAICELQDSNSESKDCAIADMLNAINIDFLGDADIEDAYSTIITGIEYIINPEPNKLPFNLGGRFRNNLIEYKKVLKIVLKNLASNEEVHEDILRQAQTKLKQLEEKTTGSDTAAAGTATESKKDKIKILHITDLHNFENSSDNNLILHNIKNNIKDVAILLVTGDLRSFGGDYNNALTKLNDIVEHLKLSKTDVFIVPGNHDCCNYDGKDTDVEEIRENIYNDKECYRKHIDNLYKSFDEYKQFLTEFYEGDSVDQGGMYSKLCTWGNCINVLTMNTALLCDSNSEQKKFVNIAELSEVEKINNFPTICISHHDIEQIHEDHKNIIKAIFEKLKVSALMSGDVHRSSVKYINLPVYKIPNYICGKFTESSKDKWSDRNVAIYEVDFNGKTLTPKLYKWEHGRYSEDNTFMKKEDTKIDSKWEYDPINLIY